jgi:hypothetical protein
MKKQPTPVRKMNAAEHEACLAEMREERRKIDWMKRQGRDPHGDVSETMQATLDFADDIDFSNPEWDPDLPYPGDFVSEADILDWFCISRATLINLVKKGICFKVPTKSKYARNPQYYFTASDRGFHAYQKLKRLDGTYRKTFGWQERMSGIAYAMSQPGGYQGEESFSKWHEDQYERDEQSCKDLAAAGNSVESIMKTLDLTKERVEGAR